MFDYATSSIEGADSLCLIIDDEYMLKNKLFFIESKWNNAFGDDNDASE
jgi:hypothetical protein